MKKFYKSKEVWILVTVVLLGALNILGLEFEGILAEAETVLVGLAPVALLVLRLFYTKDKLTLS